ncbi:MAG: ComEC/Rec2 family competence protein [Actinomycetota bacterium]
MSDRWVVALAACAALGALHPSGLPLALGPLVLVVALAVRQPAVLCVSAVLLTSALCQRSLAGLEGVPVGPVAAEVTLLSDPEPSLDGVRAEARLGSKRLELGASGPAAEALLPRLAGEHVVVRGEVQLLSAQSSWSISRHLTGRLRVHAVESWRPGGHLTRVANALRRTLLDGAEPLSPSQQALYSGLVIGDDRHQPAAMADDFQGAGLTHLLAVSGQNVAFVLVLAGPVLRRVRLWPRLALTLAVVGMFGLVTRFEPSVIRAAAMAAIATSLATIGSPTPRLRVLGLTVTALLLIDPLLVRSVGFSLSVAACAGIIVLAPRVASVLVGPRFLREAAAVTVAAQLGVAPVLLATFGPMPLAAVPANLLAVPVAGAVMVWGLTGGMVAGVAGGVAAELIHLPTRPLLGWMEEVAQRGAALHLGEAHVWHTVGVSLGLAVAVLMPRARRPALAMAAGVVVVVAVTAHAPVPLRQALAPGVVRWHGGSTDVVVLGGLAGREQRLGVASTLAALRRARVRSIDVLVLADRSISDDLVAAIASRHPAGTIVAAPDVPRPSTVMRAGDLVLRLTHAGDRLVVEAAPRAPPRSGHAAGEVGSAA